jgi:hypothetical protein
MVDMQLLNNTLVAMAVLAAAAIALSALIVAAGVFAQRRHARVARIARASRAGHGLRQHPAPATDNARSLVLR